MGSGKITKFFPGANSAYGFYSFYDQVIDSDATRIFVIKGGPGVGKSTLMKGIAGELLEKGIDVEFHCCSSDNGSVDGIKIPLLNIACIDGTAPHVVDPKYPGVVDEIINLGDLWETRGLLEHREAIMSSTRENGRLFRRAYRYLSAAKLFLDEVEGCFLENEALDSAGLDKLAIDLIKDIFADSVVWMSNVKRERHLFTTAITPDGFVNHLDCDTGHLKRRFIVCGDYGTGKHPLIRKIADASIMRGYFTEIYHCALDPQKIDHVVIPSLGTAVLNSAFPHEVAIRGADRIISTDSYACNPGNSILREREVALDLYRQCLDTAVLFLGRAKEVHDLLESYYIKNMNFDALNRVSHKVLNKILSYCEG